MTHQSYLHKPDELLQMPINDVLRTILPATLAGRCANGHERDQGRVVHAVPAMQHKPDDIACYARSLCGKTHGARSAGWVPRPDLQVTCPACQKKIDKDRQ